MKIQNATRMLKYVHVRTVRYEPPVFFFKFLHRNPAQDQNQSQSIIF